MKTSLFLTAAAFLLGASLEASATLTYDLRVHSDGGKSATVQYPTDVVELDLFAVVTGAAGNTGVEGFQDGYGSLLSTGGDIQGTLSATLTAPFNGNGSQNGAQANLDSDSDMDVGSNMNFSNGSFFFARAGSMQSSGGVAIPNGQEFKLATVTFTIGSIAGNAAPVLLNFRVADFTNRADVQALWMEDGSARNTNSGAGGTVPSIGAGVVITAIPEPSSALLLGFGALGCLARRRRR